MGTQAGGAAGDDFSFAATPLSDEGSVIAGSFQGTSTFGAGEPAETMLTGQGLGHDAFVARYGPAGQVVWARAATGDGEDHARAIAALADDSVVVTGSFQQRVSFVTAALDTFGDDDIFLARYDQGGAVQWVKQAGSVRADGAYGIAASPDGGVVISGAHGGLGAPDGTLFGPGEANETMVYPGPSTSFVAKYDADGMLRWATAGAGNACHGIVATSDGGAVTACVDWIWLIVWRFDANADLIWGDSASPGGATPYGIAWLPGNSTLLTGHFGTDPGWGYGPDATFFWFTDSQTTLSPDGATDIFVARFPP